MLCVTVTALSYLYARLLRKFLIKYQHQQVSMGSLVCIRLCMYKSSSGVYAYPSSSRDRVAMLFDTGQSNSNSLVKQCRLLAGSKQCENGNNDVENCCPRA